MGIEIEKKYLLSELPFFRTKGKPKRLKQGYLFLQKNKQLRIRIINDKRAYLCLKYTDKVLREEFEYEIPIADGIEMFKKCKLNLEKLRYEVNGTNKKYHIDIDRYPNNLLVAEVEFKSEAEYNKFKALSWFGKEITGNKEYSNITLAKQNLVFR